VDDDCDGSADEHYTPYTCGLGLCEDNSVCVGGVASCTPLPPSGIPETICNGADDDCDGATDEDWTPTTCGLGVCTATSTCTGGTETCTEGSPTGSDNNCNGIDENCNGTADENWVPYTCGVDACQRTAVCTGGVDSCTPATPGTPCDDGIACSHTDICDVTGGCAGMMYGCPIAGVCEDTVTCDGLGGCLTTFSPFGTGCVDGYSCTESDQCDGFGTCEGTPNDGLCSVLQLCRPACFPSTGCGTPPSSLTLACPPTQTLPSDATCGIALGITGQVPCLDCTAEVGQVILSHTTFDGGSGTCGLDGWTMRSGSGCWDSVTGCTPAGSGWPCCDIADGNVLRNISGDCVMRTMQNGNCGGGYEEWQIERTFDTRGLNNLEVCFNIMDYDATSNEGILLYAEDSTYSTRIFCLTGPPVTGPIPVDTEEYPYCATLPGWAENNPDVTLKFIAHSENDGEALYLDDIVVRGRSSVCAETRSTVFTEDFDPCPGSDPIPNGWNGWTVSLLRGSGPECGSWCSGGTGGARTSNDEWYMIHSVDASTLDGDVRLCFDVGDDTSDWNEWIEVSFNTGTGWQEAWYWENELGTDGSCRRICVNLTDLDPDANNNPNLQIMFWLSSNVWSEQMFIDDIEVDGAVYCAATGKVSLSPVVDVGGGGYTFDIENDTGLPLGVWVDCSWDSPPTPISDSDMTRFISP
jgi:hypothetical protein